MILTKDKNRIVYIGRLNGKIHYIGRGYITRAISLINQNGHHIEFDFDEVELLGPYSYEESKDIEKQLIEQHLPELNKKIKIGTEYLTTNSYKIMERKIRRIEKKEEERRQFKERQQKKLDKKEYIINQIKEGISLSEIARNLGCTRQYIHKIKKEISYK
jgi:AraC-like DNA-binding protein